MGIQPTYEELKRNVYKRIVYRFVAYPAYLWGIETTHKGNRWKKKNSIQPTYEELKQALELLELERIFRYPAYLWGIETCYNLFRK